MPHRTDDRFAATAPGGTLSDRWSSWLRSQMAVDPGPLDVRDLELRFLAEKLAGFTADGDLADGWFAWLGTQGRTEGTLAGRWAGYWRATAPP